MTTGNQLRDITVLHTIGLQRYSGTVLKRILKQLREMQADIEAQLKDRLPTEDNVRDATSLRLGTLLEQVRLTMNEAHSAISGRLMTDLGELAENEVEFSSQLGRLAVGTEVALATVSAPQLAAAVMSRPMQGRVLREWVEELGVRDAQRVRAQITMGYLEGESVPQVIKRIRAVSGVTERGAEVLVRTSMTHINARAVEENARANPQLFTDYQWVSVLDNRTSPVCRSRAGKTYSHGKGPLPPAHPNCRSAVFSLVKGVPAATDMGFNVWLKEQSAEAQKDILGASRYALWKDGGLTLDRFVDGGRSLTLDQLRKRDADAFKRAGL